MLSTALGFVAGCLIVQMLPVLPPSWVALAAVPPALLVLRLRWLRLPLTVAAGCVWSLWWANSILSSMLPARLEGSTMMVTGTVSGLPERLHYAERFVFDIQSIDSSDVGGVPFHGRVRLSWYGPHPFLATGDRWRLAVRLKRPHGFQNPGGFDYEGWLFRQGIVATGYVVLPAVDRRITTADVWHGGIDRLRGAIATHLTTEFTVVLPAVDRRITTADVWHGGIDRLRGAIATHLTTEFTNGASGAMLAALAVGVRDGITAAQWTVLRRTGTAHLIAISGLHIGLVASFVFALVGFIWTRWPALALRLPAPRAAALAALLAATGYAVLAGMSVSTQRALIMLVIVLGAVLAARRISLRHAYAVALLLVLIRDPLGVMGQGMWLSFAAVAVLGAVSAGRLRRCAVPPAVGAAPVPAWRRAIHWLQRHGMLWWRLQLALWIALAPLLLLFYQEFSLVSPVANLLAIPLVGFIAVPLVLLAVVAYASGWLVIADRLFAAAGWLLNHLLDWLATLGQLDVAYLSGTVPGALALVAAAIGVALLLMPRGVPGRWLGVIWLLPLALGARAALPAGQFDLTVLDVGQGLAVVARTTRHTLLFDTGGRFNPDFDAGHAVVIPFLRATGIRRLDALIISHPDRDHIGGLPAVLAEVDVGRRLAGPTVHQPNFKPCFTGQNWDWDGVHFAILSPGLGYQGSDNNSSCVLQVSGAAGSALLSADIEAPIERALVARYGTALAAQVLVVPHHGSKTSSTEPFIATVAPVIAIISAGYRNQFGHPAPRVVTRLIRHRVKIYDTIAAGAVTVHFGVAAVKVQTYRAVHRRFWFGQFGSSTL